MRCEPFPMTLVFHGWLKTLVKKSSSPEGRLEQLLSRRASIKDVVESLGVPHTEVGALHLSSAEIAFSHIAGPEERIEILPHRPPVDLSRPSLLRPESLPVIRFLADANVGKLARKLRMAGFDTAYDPNWPDETLAEISGAENRILLSKDLGLLKRGKIVYGHLVREIDPRKQLGEILHFYGLHKAIRPYSRCIRCNGILAPAVKEEILHLLEPLTKRYYHAFERCQTCRQIYWSGSHRREMEQLLAELADYQPLPY